MEAASVGSTDTLDRAEPQVATKKTGRRRKARRGGCGSPSPRSCVFCLFPFYWLINVSLKTGPDLSSSSLIPPNPTLENYKSIFQNDDFMRALLNSAIVSLVVTALSLIVGSFCAPTRWRG